MINKKRKMHEYQKLFEMMLQSLNKLPLVKKERKIDLHREEEWEYEIGLIVEYETKDEDEKVRWARLHDCAYTSEQLFPLFLENKINYETKIKFIFHHRVIEELKGKYYDFSKEITLQLKTILPYLVQIFRERDGYGIQSKKLDQKIMKELVELKEEENMKYTVRVTQRQFYTLYDLKDLYQKDIQFLLRKTFIFFIENSEALKDLKTFLLKYSCSKKEKNYFVSLDKNLLVGVFTLFYQNLKNDTFLFDEIKILSKTPFLYPEKEPKVFSFFARLIIDYLIRNHEQILKEEAL